jgi:hypothetical protein
MRSRESVPGKTGQFLTALSRGFDSLEEIFHQTSPSVEPLPSSTVLPLDGDLGRGQEASEELEAERAVQGGWSRMFGG